MPESVVLTIPMEPGAPAGNVDLFGLHDRTLRVLEESLSLTVSHAAGALRLAGAGPDLYVAERVLRHLSRAGSPHDENEIKYYIRQLRKNPEFDLGSLVQQTLKVSRKGKIVRSKTAGQAAYLEAIRTHDVVFGIGPAGTGKTYLAMAWAISRLLSEQVSRIVLVRPVVEAGESLGFLPGDFTQKIDPYLRPVYDALFDMLGEDEYKDHLERGRIEVAPLAYMRGRTLSNAVIVLDEAQNTTRAQMQMFLTRLGGGSQAIITGDVTQIDLPPSKESGLVHAVRVLAPVGGVAFRWFGRDDVVRHRLVQDIIEAYERDPGPAPAAPARPRLPRDRA